MWRLSIKVDAENDQWLAEMTSSNAPEVRRWTSSSRTQLFDFLTLGAEATLELRSGHISPSWTKTVTIKRCMFRIATTACERVEARDSGESRRAPQALGS